MQAWFGKRRWANGRWTARKWWGLTYALAKISLGLDWYSGFPPAFCAHIFLLIWLTFRSGAFGRLLPSSQSAFSLTSVKPHALFSLLPRWSLSFHSLFPFLQPLNTTLHQGSFTLYLPLGNFSPALSLIIPYTKMTQPRPSLWAPDPYIQLPSTAPCEGFGSILNSGPELPT